MVLAKFCCQAMCNFCSRRKILKEKKKRDIQLCSKKPTATAAGKPTFDCVPCNKSFPKINFLFVLSICLLLDCSRLFLL